MSDSDSTIIEEYDFDSELHKFNTDISTNYINTASSYENNLILENMHPETEQANVSSKHTNATEEMDNLFKDIAQKFNLDLGKSSAASSLNIKHNEQHSYSDSDSYSELINMKAKFKYTTSTHISDEESNVDLNNYEKGSNLENKEPKRKKYSPNIKNTNKAEKALEKQKEREIKKQEAQRDKDIKKATLIANKSNKPEESIKLITAIIDTEIISSSYGTEIINNLLTLGAQYKIKSQIMPNTITWLRNVQSHLISEDGKLSISSNIDEDKQMLLILSWKETIQLVHQNALINHIKSIQSVFGNKKISLGIFGIENYFRYFKNQKKNAIRSEVNGTENRTKTVSEFEDVAKVSRRQLECNLTELQLLCSCCYRFLETAHDVGAIIAQFTKSIAQAAYKKEKNEKEQQAEWYISGDNKDCVRVDKDGNGLQRLWQQQLTSFPLARIETAEAIIAQYPTVNSLIDAYKNCNDDNEKEQLLQELPIRRAAGPLTANRKIGPELSKKINIFINSIDGNAIL